MAATMLTLVFFEGLIVGNVATKVGEPTWWPKHVGSHSATLLDGVWDYQFTDDAVFDSMSATSMSLDLKKKAKVPSTVDAAPPGIYGLRGASYYSRTFEAPSNTSSRIELMGCAFYCKVWIDDVVVGENRAGGYAPWSVDVPASSKSEKKLTVLADNRFNSTTAPLHTGGDFWHYGGLVRSVVLHTYPDTEPVVWRAHVFPNFCDGAWFVNISIMFTSPATGEIDAKVAFDSFDETIVTVHAVEGIATISSYPVPPNLAIWNMNSPVLHTLSVSANGGGVLERFGLRKWSVVSEDGIPRIALNGDVVKLLGYNHHTQWPLTGMSPTEEQLDQDIGLLKRVGANTVRGGHYPQDQRWLDRLDETGIVMWEEALGPGVELDNTLDPDFMQQQMIQIDQMLDASLNHPSIFTWGFFNEGPSNLEEACPSYAACAAKLESRDSTRLVTWASNKQTKDKCLDSASLIAFNSYPGWYSDEGDLAAPHATWSDNADWVLENYPSTPFMISETGAGGIYEWNDNETDVMWSLKYQTEIVAADVRTVLSNPQFAALTLWHFFDFKGNDEAQAAGPCDYLPGFSYPPLCGFVNVTDNKRPGGLNHKGAVDFWRRIKPSFYAVANLYHAAAAQAGATTTVTLPDFGSRE